MSRKDMRKKITLTQGELETIVGLRVAEYSAFETEAYICAITIALNELYGFGRERNVRALEGIYDLLGSIREEPDLLNAYKDAVNKKFGITMTNRS